MDPGIEQPHSPFGPAGDKLAEVLGPYTGDVLVFAFTLSALLLSLPLIPVFRAFFRLCGKTVEKNEVRFGPLVISIPTLAVTVTMALLLWLVVRYVMVPAPDDALRLR